MKFLLAVSGSISAFKSVEVMRLLQKSGHKVKIILTKGAQKFVSADNYRYLGADAVYLHNSDFDSKNYDGNNSILHIELARWADVLLISPLSASTLSKLAQASASDLLSCIFLAWGEKPCLLFPAMNTSMLTHPFVQKNLATLNELPHVFIYPPEKGELACGEFGDGKLPAPKSISRFAQVWNLSRRQERVLISSGPTLSPLDTFRYLTNGASGKTGLYLAEESLRRGLNVTVVSGPGGHELYYHLLNHPSFELFLVKTTQEMAQAIKSRLPDSHFFISAAAVSDFEFETQATKIKKEEFGGFLAVKKATDILQETVEKRSQYPLLKKIIGFAAENYLTIQKLQAKMQRKPVDLLVGNKVHNGLIGGEQLGFNQEKGEYLLLTIKESMLYPGLSKIELANKILDFCLVEPLIENSFQGESVHEFGPTTQ